MPSVSVIIPNYNHAPYLQQRIDSVLNQTYHDFEVIILDDCSADNSKIIIEPYRLNKKVKHIVYNEQNSGSTFNQWMKGISLATGKYIWIAESDDWCEPSFLENLLPYMLAKPDCVIGFCQSYCIVGNKIWPQSTHPLLSDYMEGKAFIKGHMVAGNSIYNASMVLWKREAFQNISHDFLGYKFCGDWLFWIELCTLGDIYISGKVLNYFRKHDKDVSGKAYSSGFNFIEELMLLEALYDKRLIEYPLYKKQVARRFFEYKRKESIVAPEMKKAIRERFIKKVPFAYLFRNYLILLLKFKGYIFLKKFIEKNR